MSDLSLILDPPLARIVLNRPERRNAVSQTMWRDLRDVCWKIENCADVGAVIVEGSGGHFCSGADISEFDEVFLQTDRAKNYLNDIESALNALHRLNRPSIATLAGACVGGGLAIALACDLRYVAENAYLAIPPAKLGLLYGAAETQLLLQTVGAAVARDLLFSGRAINVTESLRIGLVTRVLPSRELDEAVQAQALQWTKLSRASISGAKQAIRAALEGHIAEVRALVEATAMGEDFREGRTAFREKRPPAFLRRS